MFSCLPGEVINKDKEIKRCLIDAYRKTDEEFLIEATKQYVMTKCEVVKYSVDIKIYTIHHRQSQSCGLCVYVNSFILV